MPNVFLAKCSEQHEKGETILVSTKYGKENESIVFNLMFEKDGFYYYSIVRADGFNVQEWAKQRAERRREWAASAEQKSNGTITHLTKIGIFFLSVNLSKLGIIAKKDI